MQLKSHKVKAEAVTRLENSNNSRSTSAELPVASIPEGDCCFMHRLSSLHNLPLSTTHQKKIFLIVVIYLIFIIK